MYSVRLPPEIAVETVSIACDSVRPHSSGTYSGISASYSASSNAASRRRFSGVSCSKSANTPGASVRRASKTRSAAMRSALQKLIACGGSVTPSRQCRCTADTLSRCSAPDCEMPRQSCKTGMPSEAAFVVSRPVHTRIRFFV